MNFEGTGYRGRILRIDLTKNKVTVQEFDKAFSRLYLGGNGFSIRIILDELNPSIDPFDPENILTFMTGPATGTIIPATTRFHSASKSPLTNQYFDSTCGGKWARVIKLAGYDGIVIKGRAEKPTLLYIRDGEVELKDASAYWGKKTTESQQMLKKDLNEPDLESIVIGPAGENLVRYACLLSGFRVSGRGGLGAVMGSKNLKAICASGEGEITLANEDRARDYIRGLVKKLVDATKALRILGTPSIVFTTSMLGILGTRNWREEYFEHWEKLSGDVLMKRFYTNKSTSCFACPISCGKHSRVVEGKHAGTEARGPEYENIYAFGFVCGNSSMEDVIAAVHKCDELGLDTISTGVTIAFAMECFERGLIDRNDTDGLELKFGNCEAMLEMIEKIAYKRGFGKVLAEGCKRASQIIGKGSEYFAMHIKGLELPAHSPRGVYGLTLGYSTSTRGGSHHDYRPTAEYSIIDRAKIDGKPEWVIEVQHMTAVGDSLIICRFTERALGFSLTEEYVKIVDLATGFDIDLTELKTIGERIYNMERLFNVKCGVARKDDTIPKRLMIEPIPEGPSKGMHVKPQVLELMKDKYYELRGWDKDTGAPTIEKLKSLGII
ncbi:MAG: aldehyde ferredoxin oxidoreductase family protein [Nitrososphaerota archaeon]|nr:aldehyde ferredoxin oxidoreductase family protein [Nitrososphaerales archaeon]MDW8045302.1 aldehyde ferredoxin oxidoreductase family protein [Nitrososphaerota archaeon]